MIALIFEQEQITALPFNATQELMLSKVPLKTLIMISLANDL